MRLRKGKCIICFAINAREISKKPKKKTPPSQVDPLPQISLPGTPAFPLPKQLQRLRVRSQIIKEYSSHHKKATNKPRLPPRASALVNRSPIILYHAACPPSILRSDPVIKLLASEMRNTPAPRYSSGLLSRPSIFCVGQSRRRSGYWSKRASTMAVTM